LDHTFFSASFLWKEPYRKKERATRGEVYVVTKVAWTVWERKVVKNNEKGERE
jgi:hypothetical protein